MSQVHFVESMPVGIDIIDDLPFLSMRHEDELVTMTLDQARAIANAIDAWDQGVEHDEVGA